MSNCEAAGPLPTPSSPTAPSTATDAATHGNGRRAFLRTALTGSAALGAALALGGAGQAVAAPARPTAAPWPLSSTPATMTPNQALKRLVAGNNRWRAGAQQHPHESAARRLEAVSGQQPFALVLSCIDSRVPPELVFDQGLGDLMVVRSAGCVLDSAVIGSLKYGVLELNIPLLVTLGHQHCGAVKAAIQTAETGAQLPEHLDYLVDRIIPSIDHTTTGEAQVDATTNAFTRSVRDTLSAEVDIAPRVADGRIKVVSARYQLTTQRVHGLA
ncbi:carbonic anhydrase [Streptomyces bohaiensis]|uniref:Carbonic anhydrase n=2 Tax=Streptomyces bohaiensis TaxID=1431344 RepID=A0ABX1CFW6_9ACTN|nr:carbonic anhydrase [Streptomyces bohaiensis]NJQ16813.1 carbonic anhydrase [Streptomyces bohaiensis]